MILAAIAWWASGVVGYLLIRASYKRDNLKWTVESRNLHLFIGVLVPVSLFVSGLIMSQESTKESSW